MARRGPWRQPTLPRLDRDFAGDKKAMGHLINHEYLEEVVGIPHGDIKQLEYLENDGGNAMTVLNTMALRHMSEEQLEAIEPTHESDPEGRFYRLTQICY